MWKIEERSLCRAIVDENGQEITFIDSEPRSFEGKPCGSVTSQGRTKEELKAITHLIGSAPDLLEACHCSCELCQMMHSGKADCKPCKIGKAINKAKGA